MTVPSSTADIVDIQFSLIGSALPVDYADALWQSLQTALPWLAETPSAGIHPVSGLSHGQSGWYLSRRSRLGLRLPRQQAEAALALAGRQLTLAAEVIEVGAGSVRELRFSPVIHARCVTFAAAGAPVQDEAGFVAACLAQFAGWDVRPQMICGKAGHAATPLGGIAGFSLLLAGLDQEANLYLQRHGLGVERLRGCGLFVPHKTFSAVTLE